MLVTLPSSSICPNEKLRCLSIHEKASPRAHPRAAVLGNLGEFDFFRGKSGVGARITSTAEVLAVYSSTPIVFASAFPLSQRTKSQSPALLRSRRPDGGGKSLARTDGLRAATVAPPRRRAPRALPRARAPRLSSLSLSLRKPGHKIPETLGDHLYEQHDGLWLKPKQEPSA